MSQSTALSTPEEENFSKYLLAFMAASYNYIETLNRKAQEKQEEELKDEEKLQRIEQIQKEIAEREQQLQSLLTESDRLELINKIKSKIKAKQLEWQAIQNTLSYVQNRQQPQNPNYPVSPKYRNPYMKSGLGYRYPKYYGNKKYLYPQGYYQQTQEKIVRPSINQMGQYYQYPENVPNFSGENVNSYATVYGNPVEITETSPDDEVEEIIRNEINSTTGQIEEIPLTRTESVGDCLNNYVDSGSDAYRNTCSAMSNR